MYHPLGVGFFHIVYQEQTVAIECRLPQSRNADRRPHTAVGQIDFRFCPCVSMVSMLLSPADRAFCIN